MHWKCQSLIICNPSKNHNLLKPFCSKSALIVMSSWWVTIAAHNENQISRLRINPWHPWLNSPQHQLIWYLAVRGNAAWWKKATFLKLDISKQEREGGGWVRMDASANLWTDTKEDTLSALYRREIKHRTQVTDTFWKRKELCFAAATAQLLLIVSKDGSSVAALFTHVWSSYFRRYSRFYLWMMNASIDNNSDDSTFIISQFRNIYQPKCLRRHPLSWHINNSLLLFWSLAHCAIYAVKL